jgi:hypothetical protein
MTRQHSPKTREIGQQRIRLLTNVAVASAVVGTGALAAFVGHEYGSKSTSHIPATQTTEQGGLGQGDAGSGSSGTSGSSGASGVTGVSGGSSQQTQQAPAPQPQAISGGS